MGKMGGGVTKTALIRKSDTTVPLRMTELTVDLFTLYLRILSIDKERTALQHYKYNIGILSLSFTSAFNYSETKMKKYVFMNILGDVIYKMFQCVFSCCLLKIVNRIWKIQIANMQKREKLQKIYFFAVSIRPFRHWMALMYSNYETSVKIFATLFASAG